MLLFLKLHITCLYIIGVIDGNFCTIELQSQFKEAFPSLHAKFMKEQEELAIKKLSKKKRKKSATVIQSEIEEISPILGVENKLETTTYIKKTSRKKKGTTKIQSGVKETSPIMCNETEQEKVIEKTIKKKKDTTEVSSTLRTKTGQETVTESEHIKPIKKTSEKREDTAEMQSETSPIMCGQNEQVKMAKGTAGIKSDISDGTELEKKAQKKRAGKPGMY